MKKFYFLFLLLSSTFIHAQFSGSYAVSNWSLVNSIGANGSVDVSGAPATIIINGSDDQMVGGDVTVDYVITTVVTGAWSFNWSYSTTDGPQFDPAGVMINGVFTHLTSNMNGQVQSGTYNGSSVSAGSTIGFRINSTDNQLGNGILTISNFSPPGMILPVSLSYFKAEVKNGVSLTWKSESEINASHYEVEKGTTANSFKNIGVVNAAGQEIEYSFHDTNPSSGVNYYRLKMVDADGNFKYSSTIVVKQIAAASFNVFPNPAKSELFFQLQADESVTNIVQVFNAAGELVFAKSILPDSFGTCRIETSQLKPGMYFIRLQNGRSSTFIKQ